MDSCIQTATNWKNIYNERKSTPEEAISLVKSGDRLVFGHALGEPDILIHELVNQKERFCDVEIVHMIALGDSDYCKEDCEGHFKHNSLFGGPGSRKALNEKRADFTPVFYSEIPRLFYDNILPVDAAFIQIAPPDEEGYCSYGISVDYTAAAAECAKVVLAEINHQMPRTYGSAIHISKITKFVETDRPVRELKPLSVTDVERKIGENVAELIPDGANLQLGIGGIPDALLTFLKDKKDLGIHTEMFSDGVVNLFNEGVINGKYNNLHPGKLVACFLMGTKKLYDFVHKNENVLMKPADYTNKITVAGMVNNLISINSAIQIDLNGQVCADTIGYKQYSGIGGQVDFVRAASLSNGGKSIMAMPSTAKNDTVSKIVVNLDPGACVTTSRSDVHYVVTEYGIANLRGKSIRQRVDALISIAHPKFKDELRHNAKLVGII